MDPTEHADTAPAARHYGPRITTPQVRNGTMDGAPVVFVGLSGASHGKEMILSADWWPEVSRRWGPSWLLIQGPRPDRCYVVASSREAGRAAGMRLPRMARLLTSATTKQRVKHANGNPLDLRDSNLVVVNTGEPKARRPKPAKAPKPAKQALAKTTTPKRVEIDRLDEMALLVVMVELGRKLNRSATRSEAVSYALNQTVRALRAVGQTPASRPSKAA